MYLTEVFQHLLCVFPCIRTATSDGFFVFVLWSPQENLWLGYVWNTFVITSRWLIAYSRGEISTFVRDEEWVGWLKGARMHAWGCYRLRETCVPDSPDRRYFLSC